MVANISVGTKVLAKIRAFPYWSALIEAISGDGIVNVKFPDGKLGMNATVALSLRIAQKRPKIIFQ